MGLFRYKAGFEKASSSDDPIQDLLPIVHRVAAKMARNLPAHVCKDDLISLGTLGLLEAIRRFDPLKGVKLETFVTWRIRGAILDGLRDMDPVPRQIREYAREIEKAYLQIEASELRSATDEEMCKVLGINEGELNKRLYDISRSTVIYLDTSFDGLPEENANRMTQISDTSGVLPETEAIRQEMIRKLADVVDRLPEKEKWVISLYYFDELTFKEIAEIIGVTVSRISQLHTKAIFRLKASVENGL